jgi:hypothetical protein
MAMPGSRDTATASALAPIVQQWYAAVRGKYAVAWAAAPLIWKLFARVEVEAHRILDLV